MYSTQPMKGYKMQEFDVTVHPIDTHIWGPTKQIWRPTYVTIKYANGRLSISGVEGPRANGDAYGSCGQIDMHLRSQLDSEDVRVSGEWTRADVKRLFDIWERWHLNDMKAGSPRQEAYMREHPVHVVYPDSHYDKASEMLAEAGLNPDTECDDYKYGSAWKTEEVPSDVLEWLSSLPSSGTDSWGRKLS